MHFVTTIIFQASKSSRWGLAQHWPMAPSSESPPFGSREVFDDFKKDGTFLGKQINTSTKYLRYLLLSEWCTSKKCSISALMRLHQPCWSRNIISKVWCSINCEGHTSPHRQSGWGGFLGMWKGCYGSWKRRLCQKENEIVCHLNCVLGMVFGHTSLLWDEFPAQPSNVCSFPRSIPVPASCSCHWPAARHRAVHQMVFLLQ